MMYYTRLYTENQFSTDYKTKAALMHAAYESCMYPFDD